MPPNKLKPYGLPEKIEAWFSRWTIVLVAGFIAFCAIVMVIMAFLIIFGVIRVDGIHYVIELH